jgi:hypothetical protein
MNDTEPPVADRLRWDDSLTRVRSGRAFLRSRIRLGLAVGATIMFVGALLPWAEGMVGLLPVRFGGLDGAADGLILAAFAIVALLMARSPDFLEAVDGPRRWAPLLLGLACVGIWLLGWQSAQFRIQGWVDDDGSGAMTIWYWVTGVGAAIVAVVGGYSTLRYHPGQTSNPLALVRMPRRSDAPTLLGWVFGIGGLVVGAWAAGEIFEPAARSAPMLFMAAGGVIAGAYIGRGVGRLISG